MRVESLGEQQTAADPALVSTEPVRDRALRKPVVAVEGAHEPGLLELGEPATVVQRGHEQLGLDGVHVGDAYAHGGPPEGASGAGALEAVDDLEATAVRERGQRIELPEPRERAPHGLERGGLAESQGREPLAENADLDLALIARRDVHEDEDTSLGVGNRWSCVTRASFPADCLVIS